MINKIFCWLLFGCKCRCCNTHKKCGKSNTLCKLGIHCREDYGSGKNLPEFRFCSVCYKPYCKELEFRRKKYL